MYQVLIYAAQKAQVFALNERMYVWCVWSFTFTKKAQVTYLFLAFALNKSVYVRCVFAHIYQKGAGYVPIFGSCPQ